ncbi:hypothetical protein Gorai_021828 [Gossypium raimondii]|uniref:S12 n=1 Tax=Gossypium raimondii TaxID=29730 RepID=A0A7J8NRM7_GOSRA|nr:hypothetical protein [Gossypium raimondii]
MEERERIGVRGSWGRGRVMGKPWVRALSISFGVYTSNSAAADFSLSSPQSLWKPSPQLEQPLSQYGAFWVDRVLRFVSKAIGLIKGISFRKTRGMGAGRKLRTHRRRQRWADKAYKKSNLGNEWKKPFAGSSHAKGIVLEKIGIEAKQPNSAIRKCARVQLIKNGKKIAAFVPNDGCLNYIEENVSRT